MSKPFSTKELAARIKALMRRSGVPESDLLEACGIQIDLGSHRLIIQGTNIHIGPTEYRLQVQLLDHIWGRSSYIEIRTVDVHVLRLRKNTRDMDREHRKLQMEEKKAMAEVKKLSNAGQPAAAKMMAKNVVQLRKQQEKMVKAKAQLSGVQNMTKVTRQRRFRCAHQR